MSQIDGKKTVQISERILDRCALSSLQLSTSCHPSLEKEVGFVFFVQQSLLLTLSVRWVMMMMMVMGGGGGDGGGDGDGG
jgi:hypothetical protein